jgi:hypothetical protein
MKNSGELMFSFFTGLPEPLLRTLALKSKQHD